MSVTRTWYNARTPEPDRGLGPERGNQMGPVNVQKNGPAGFAGRRLLGGRARGGGRYLPARRVHLSLRLRPSRLGVSPVASLGVPSSASRPF